MAKKTNENELQEVKEIVSELSDEKTAEEAVGERAIVFEEALEAILFAAGHPISFATLARVFDMTPGRVKDLVFEYSLKYNNSDIPRGVILLTYGDSCQLCTKKYYLNEIREALGIKKSGTLSTSSMEALAIVAYNQPVTRAFVDTLRRADSSYAMNNLIDRGLIESKGRLDAPGRPMLYGTTSDFLRAFGIKDFNSLPNISEEIDAMFQKAKIVENSTDFTEEELAIEGDISTDKLAETVNTEKAIEENSPDQSSEYDNYPSADDNIIFDGVGDE